MSQKDYYKILGVSQTAEPDEIKKTYRKLAVKYHPDKNPKNKKQAEERFKEISEAYYILNDPQRRQEYDLMKKGGAGMFGQGNFAQARGFNFEEIFGGFRNSQSSGRGFEDIIENLFTGSASSQQRGCRYSSGTQDRSEIYTEVQADIETTLNISKALAASGGKVQFKDNHNKKITVRIPANTKDGQKMRLARAGRDCPACHHPGDLILKLKVKK